MITTFVPAFDQEGGLSISCLDDTIRFRLIDWENVPWSNDCTVDDLPEVERIAETFCGVHGRDGYRLFNAGDIVDAAMRLLLEHGRRRLIDAKRDQRLTERENERLHDVVTSQGTEITDLRHQAEIKNRQIVDLLNGTADAIAQHAAEINAVSPMCRCGHPQSVHVENKHVGCTTTSCGCAAFRKVEAPWLNEPVTMDEM